MRRDDKEANKRYFRSSDRFIRQNGEWYFSTREGDHGPFRDELTARRELNRHVVAQIELKLFQQKRELRKARQTARQEVRKAPAKTLFTLEAIVD